MPDWIEALRIACEANTQAAIAERVGYSAAVINQVLKGTYRGDMRRVEDAVRGALMGERVDCPVVGDLPRQRCIEHQRRSFAATNPTRVQMSRTCKSCEHATVVRTDGGDRK